MRVAIIRQQYTPFGGAERFLNTAIEALLEANQDLEIDLITRGWKPFPKDIKRLHIIRTDPFYIGRLWRDWSFGKAACKRTSIGSYDLVQSHERLPCADIFRAGDGVHKVWLRQRGKLSTIKRWLTLLSPYHSFALHKEREMFHSKRLSIIVVNSKKTGSEIEEEFDVAKNKIKLVYNATNPKIFNPENASKKRAEIRSQLDIQTSDHLSLFVGSGYERKGVPTLLRAFKLLDPSHHLLIIGKDRNLKKYAALIKRENLEKQIHLLGPQENTLHFYGACDLFAFPSLYDPLPNSVLEAAACGLPILSSTSTGAAEIASRLGVKSLDPFDPIAWAAGIAEQRKVCSEERQGLILSTPEQMAHELSEIYQAWLKKDTNE